MRSSPSSRTGTTGTPSRAAIIPTPGLERLDLAASVRRPSGKDQHRIAVADELSDVAQRLPVPVSRCGSGNALKKAEAR